jgi:hypothetical protein
MAERGVEKAVRHFLTKACHVGFRQLSRTYDKKGESEKLLRILIFL